METNIRSLIESFHLSEIGLREARVAWAEDPDGLEAIAWKALGGDDPGALLIWMIRNKQHVGASTSEPRPTGWRMVRGANGEGGATYVRDPEGFDRLPSNYDTTPAPYRFNAVDPGGERAKLEDEPVSEAELITFDEWKRRRDEQNQ